METLADLMTPAPCTVRPDTPVEEAARLILRLGIRHLPLVDGDHRGLVTDRAVFAHGGLLGAHEELWVPFDDDAPTRCGELPLAPAVEARPDEPLAVVLRRMREGGVDVAVALDDRRLPVGILTEHDVVRLAARRLPDDLRPPERTTPLVTVAADAPARQAQDILETHPIRHVLVLGPHGVLQGVLTWADLVSEAARSRALRAEEVARMGRLVVETQTPTLRRAAERMARERVACLPVVDEAGRPVDLLTRADLVDALWRALDPASAGRAGPPARP